MEPRDKRLLEYLQAGYHLSSVDGVHYGFGTDLRKVISNLRKLGYQVKDVWEKRNGKKFKRYFIER